MRRSYLGLTQRRVRPKPLPTPLVWRVASQPFQATWWRLCGSGSRTNLRWASSCENTAGGLVIGRNSVEDGQHHNLKRPRKETVHGESERKSWDRDGRRHGHRQGDGLGDVEGGRSFGDRESGCREGRRGRTTDPAGGWPGSVPENRREQARRSEGAGRTGGGRVRQARCGVQQRRYGRGATSLARNGHREGSDVI